MAFFRALETARAPGERVCDDPLATAFLGPSLRLVAALARWPPAGALVRDYVDRRWPGALTSAVARTRFIDDVAASRS
jgi:O-methyltransferase involved in polyketide biosynthesis